MSESVVSLHPGLMHDASLLDNLLAFENFAGRAVLSSRLDEIAQLFVQCACPLDFDRAANTLPSDATPTERFQICVGRALLQRPSHLEIDLDHWPADCNVSPERFGSAYALCFPWRTLTLTQKLKLPNDLSEVNHAFG